MKALALPRSRQPRKPRRQADRTAETRARIMAAVVECIGDLGFQRTTAVEIARRSGVTWGAVQHHFGGKDGILAAVLEETFGRFAARFDDFPTDRNLEERCSLFVDRAWEHFSSSHYRTTFEILLHYLPAHTPEEGPTLQAQMLDAWDTLWKRLFADSKLPAAQRRVLAQYTVGVLSGLAINLTLQGRRGSVPAGALQILKDTLVRELGHGEGAERKS